MGCLAATRRSASGQAEWGLAVDVGDPDAYRGSWDQVGPIGVGAVVCHVPILVEQFVVAHEHAQFGIEALGALAFRVCCPFHTATAVFGCHGEQVVHEQLAHALPPMSPCWSLSHASKAVPAGMGPNGPNGFSTMWDRRMIWWAATARTVCRLRTVRLVVFRETSLSGGLPGLRSWFSTRPLDCR
jgi:hypothetical protein